MQISNLSSNYDRTAQTLMIVSEIQSQIECSQTLTATNRVKTRSILLLLLHNLLSWFSGTRHYIPYWCFTRFFGAYKKRGMCEINLMNTNSHVLGLRYFNMSRAFMKNIGPH